MKIALFYIRNMYASWYALGGYCETLTRMGHEVLDCPLPHNDVTDVEYWRTVLPPVEVLNQADVVLSMFHEYIQPWIQQVYGQAQWEKLTVPVIARFDESMDRSDLGLPGRVAELKKWAQHYSFPAKQDADRFVSEWLPFGADVTIFKPLVRQECNEHNAPQPLDHNTGRQVCHRLRGHEGECSNDFEKDRSAARTAKKYDLGFVGSMYPLRINYVSKLGEHLDNTVTFNCGPVVVQDLAGIRGRESTELLVENYRQIKVFFCLPPMSRLLVCKVFEVMACGTFLMYPKLPGDARRNNEIFEDGKHLVYYDYGRVADNAKQIRWWVDHDEERETIAAAGCKKVHSEYRLDQMLEKLLAMVKPAITSKLHLVAR